MTRTKQRLWGRERLRRKDMGDPLEMRSVLEAFFRYSVDLGVIEDRGGSIGFRGAGGEGKVYSWPTYYLLPPAGQEWSVSSHLSQ